MKTSGLHIAWLILMIRLTLCSSHEPQAGSTQCPVSYTFKFSHLIQYCAAFSDSIKIEKHPCGSGNYVGMWPHQFKNIASYEAKLKSDVHYMYAVLFTFK